MKWWTGEYLASGKRRFESRGGFTDEDEAFTYGQDQMYEIRHGTHVSNRDGSTLMTDWLDDWLESIDLAHLSLRNYKSIINKHIRPRYENKTVADVDLISTRAFRKHLNNSGLRKSSIQNIWMVFGMVMDDAAAAGLCKTSPVERQRRRGKYTKKPRERKKDMTATAVNQLALNANARWGYAGYVFIWTMALTGMRPAELFGLTREYCYPNWPASDPRNDPDEEDRYDEDVVRYGRGSELMPAIRVEQQVQYEDGKLLFFPPKYGSKRTLVIPPFLAQLLEKLLESHEQSWVFPAPEGGCLGRIAFSKVYWRPIADGCDALNGPRGQRPAIEAVPSFQGRRLYLIRHGHKSWLDEDGHARFTVETRMGHEVPGVEGTYSSVTVPMERAVMDALQKRWEGLGDVECDPPSPGAVRLSIASLVRAAIASGVEGWRDVLAEVRRVRPEVSERTVKRTVQHVRSKG
ncbi:integrase [Streptomyces sp. NPDC047315]|uniref:tyrosine-type recombinase/integrase n=1 Tax=Streptomyces sp. NPDC047315 TaxID=3155142 RepID=UPI0033DD8134